MRLICPNCDAQYEVDDGAIPHGGRDVQCSNCGQAWFQMHADALVDADEAEVIAVAVPDPVMAVPDPIPVTEAPPPAPVVGVPDETTVVAVAGAPPAALPPPDVPPDAPAALVRRTLDDNLLAVLREEAAREAAERRAEAGRMIETQPDLGALDAGARAPVAPVAAASVQDHPVTERPNPRRDLLPDIEEINSTLRPGSEARDEGDSAIVATAPKRMAFRTGFFSVLLVTLVLVMLYTMAPQLAARFPGTATTLTAYVATVDALRVWLDGLMQSAAGGLRNLTGEG